MFERAVICTDLSPSSESIIACAGTLGVLGVREAVLAYVMDLSANSVSANRDEDAAFMRQAVAIERAGIKVHVDTSVGYPPSALERIAEEHGASLIVVGSHGSGLFVTSFSGSVSSDLVRISARPVLLAVLSALGPTEQSSAMCSRLLSRVLFPTQLSEFSSLAEGYLLKLAEQGLESVEIFHVVDNTAGNGTEHRRLGAQERLDVIAAALADAGVGEVRTRIVVGSPEREMGRRAAASGYSMIVMAPRYDESSGSPLGGVTHGVIQAATAPVLLIPPGCHR